MMPSIVHYRWESSKRAVGGAHVHGRRARLWRRDWCVVPQPLPKDRILELYDEGCRSIPCPLCLAKIAEQRAAAEQKAEQRPPRGFKWWEQKPDDDGDGAPFRMREDDDLLRDTAYAGAQKGAEDAP